MTERIFGTFAYAYGVSASRKTNARPRDWLRRGTWFASASHREKRCIKRWIKKRSRASSATFSHVIRLPGPELYHAFGVNNTITNWLGKSTTPPQNTLMSWFEKRKRIGTIRLERFKITRNKVKCTKRMPQKCQIPFGTLVQEWPLRNQVVFIFYTATITMWKLYHCTVLLTNYIYYYIIYIQAKLDW